MKLQMKSVIKLFIISYFKLELVALKSNEQIK